MSNNYYFDPKILNQSREYIHPLCITITSKVTNDIILTQQSLKTGRALGQPLTRVTLREEHAAGDAIGCGLEPEAYTHQQVLPARHVPHLVFDGLLRGVHGVPVATVDAL